jgi:hypothetical protein
MKAALYFSLVVTMLISCNKNNEKLSEASSCNFIDFYYYQDSTISLGELSNQYIVVAFDSNATESQIRSYIAADKELDQSYKFTLNNSKTAVLKFREPKTCEAITATIARMQKSSMVAFVHYAMKTNDCLNAFGMPMGNLCINSYNSFFYVKVKDANNLTDLIKLAQATNTIIIEQYIYDPKWVTLKATKNSKGDALSMANYFKESKLFTYAHPDPMKWPVE